MCFSWIMTRNGRSIDSFLRNQSHCPYILTNVSYMSTTQETESTTPAIRLGIIGNDCLDPNRRALCAYGLRKNH